MLTLLVISVYEFRLTNIIREIAPEKINRLMCVVNNAYLKCRIRLIVNSFPLNSFIFIFILILWRNDRPYLLTFAKSHNISILL